MADFIDKIRYNGTDYSIGNNYSTEEQVVGVWTNGKPIYRKSFPFSHTYNTTTSSGEYYFDHNIQNMDIQWINNSASFAIIEGYSYSLGGCYVLSNALVIAARAKVSKTNIGIDFFGKNMTLALDGVVVVEYTKTTD